MRIECTCSNGSGLLLTNLNTCLDHIQAKALQREATALRKWIMASPLTCPSALSEGFVGNTQTITAQPELQALISKLANDCFCATVILSSSHSYIPVCSDCN